MKKIFLLAVAAFALASCDNNDKPLPTSNAVVITANIGESPRSRAYNSTWEAGDAIGITSTFGDNDQLARFINLKYVLKSFDEKEGIGNFWGETPIFFYNAMTLTAYHPYTGDEGFLPGDQGVISAVTSIENQTDKKQRDIDFLWDSRQGIATTNNVQFEFRHKMSKLTFAFLSSEPQYDENGVMESEGVDVGTMISYEIEGLGIEGTFDTTTGICAIDESKGRPGLKVEFPKGTVKDDTPMPSLIVFPQTKPAKGFILHIKTDELENETAIQKYKCNLPFAQSDIMAGYHYSFTIQVTKRGLKLGALTIKPWATEDDGKYVTATVDGDPEYKEKTGTESED